MQTAPRISLAAPLPPAMDFASLLAAATATAQAVSGGRWTDYNEHDLGVTILEALCYALTDIAYRAGHPMADILASSGKAHDVSAKQQTLFTPESVLTSAPVTRADLQDRITAKIPTTRSARLHPVQGRRAHFALHLEQYARILGDGVQRSTLMAQVRTLVAASRPIGIAIDDIRFADQVTYVIKGRIELSANTVAEEVMAETLIAAMRLDDPASQSATALQFGPALKSARAAVALSPMSLRAAIQSLAGVLQVDRLTLQAQGESPVPDARFLSSAPPGPPKHSEADQPVRLIPSLEERDLKQLEMTRNGARIPVDAAAVNAIVTQYEADQRWSALFDASTLQRQHEGAVPSSNAQRHLGRYRSVQFLFPQIYGLGEFGPDAPTLQLDGMKTATRKAEVLHEQVLTDELAQLNAISLLFSSKPHNQSYFTQPLVHDPPRPGDPSFAAQVLGQVQGGDWLRRYREKLKDIRRATDPFRDRNTRAASHWLARFGIRFDDAALRRQYEGENLPPDHAQDCIIAQKRGYLTGLPELGRDRGLGPDLSAQATECALESAVRIKAGLPDHMLIVEHAKLPLPDAPDDMQCLALDRPGGKLHLVMEERLLTSALDIVAGLLRRAFAAMQPAPGGNPQAAGIAIRRLPDYTTVLTLDIAGLPRMVLAERFTSVAQARAALSGLATDTRTMQPARFPIGFGGNFVSVFLQKGDKGTRSGRAEFRRFVEQTLLDHPPAHLGFQCLWVAPNCYARMKAPYLAATAQGLASPELLHRIEDGCCRALIDEYLADAPQVAA